MELIPRTSKITKNDGQADQVSSNIREYDKYGKLPVHEEKTATIAAKIDNMIIQEDSSSGWFTSGLVGAMKQPMSKNVAPIPVMPNRLKRAAPTDFHYMNSLLAHRSHQKLRSQADNAVSSVTRSYRSHTPSQGFITYGPSSFFTAAHAPVITTSLDNCYPTMRTTYDNVSPPPGFFRFNESGVGETELKEEVANAVGSPILSPLKDGLCNKESSDDIPGSKDVIPRKSIPLRKKLCRTRREPIKGKRKSGRAIPKKPRTCQPSVPTEHHPNDKPSDDTGEFDNDRDDLVVAASSVTKAREHACSDQFWKKMESFFAPPMVEDLLFLKHRSNPTKAPNQTVPLVFTDVYEALGVATKCSCMREFGNLNQRPTQSTDFGGPKPIYTSNVVPSLFQRVLSAFIDEDEGKESYSSNEGTNNDFLHMNDDSHKDRMEFEVRSKVDLQFQKPFLLDGSSGSGSASSNTTSKKGASSSFCHDELHQGDDCLPFSNGEILFRSDRLDQNVLHSTRVDTLNCRYQALSLDVKLYRELQSVSLNCGQPHVDLGEAWIDKEIDGLQRELYQQTAKVNNSLRRIEAGIQCEQELEKRRIEESAMDQLVQMAYNRIMVGRPPIKALRTRRVSKPVALAFANRTLARCKEFEDSGRSCFSEPHLQEIIFKPPSKIDVEPSNGLIVKKGARKNAKRKSSASGPILGSVQKHDCQSNKPQHGSSGFQRQHPSLITSGQSSRINHPGQVGSEEANLTSHLGEVRSESFMKQMGKNGDKVTGNSTSGSVHKPKTTLPQKRQLSRIGTQELAKCSQLPDVKPEDPITTEKSKEPKSRANVSQALSEDTQLDEIDLITVFDDPDFPEDINALLNFDDEDLSETYTAGLDVPMDNLSDIDFFI